MTTYGDLVNRALRALKDVDQTKYEDDLVYDGLASAHDAILPWVPNYGVATLTAGSIGDVFALPIDCYVVDAVQLVANGLFIPKSILSPNTVRGQYTTTNDWSDYPHGYISLSSTLDEGSTIKVYYRASWDKPANSADTAHVITPPSYAHNAMVYYACSHCLIPEAISNANLSQFKMRPEIGTPEDLPIEIMSDFFLKRFYAEMKMMPPFVRAGGV